ncbi:MAG: hypothetical protein CM1200mP22_33690 [Dehalococcoidia bacterium]|nr:MAG: hypothetical protein CM1200mP22_33690 [Dehalococcoidia bacterium]
MNIVAAEPSSLQTTAPLTLGIQGMRIPLHFSKTPKIGTVRDPRGYRGALRYHGLKKRAGIRPALLGGLIDFDDQNPVDDSVRILQKQSLSILVGLLLVGTVPWRRCRIQRS